MKMSQAFPSSYLKAADLNGKAVRVTIESVSVEKIGDDTKPVLHFVGKDKGLVLNKTNTFRIVEAVGSDETNDWEGWSVTLYACKVDFQGKRVDALRVDYSDNAKPPVTNVNGNGAGVAKQLAQAPIDNTDWKLKLNEKLKAYCAEQKLDWNENKLKLLDTYTGTQNFFGMTQEQAKLGCANLDDPNFLPF